MGQDALVTITLDSGTKRYSIHGTSTASAYYEARIDRVSGAYKAIAPGGGTTRIGSVSVTLADPDGALRKQAGTEQFRNRAARVELIDTDSGATSVLVDGYVKAKHTPSAQFILDIRDNTLDILGETFARRVTPDLFTYVPDRTPAKLIPIPFGTVRSSDFSNQGHIPAYLIDPAVGGATFKYVLAQHQLKSNTQATGLYVYRYGELVAESFYTVSYATVDGVSMTFLEFTVDQRERGSLSYNEITYDAKGLTDDGLQTGTLLENPASILEALLDRFGPLTSSTDIDQTLLTAAESAYNTAGIVAGGAIVDKNDTHLTIIDRFNVGFALNFWRTNSGLYGMRYDNAAAPTGYVPHHRDGENIIAGSFQGEATPDSAATLELFYAHDHARNSWDSSKSLNDATAQTQLGREVKRRQDLWGIRDINNAQTIGEIKLFQERPERLPYRYRIPADLNLELGGGTQVTHFAGQSADGAGFARKSFRVYGIRTSIDDKGALMDLSVLDAPGLTPTTFSDTEPSRETSLIKPTVYGFSSDLIFEEVDYNTVRWANSGTQKIYEPGPNGTSHEITSGNTYDMTTETWIYWDPDTSLTVLQTTTTKSDIADNPRSLLLCKCSPGSDSNHHPIIEPIYGHSQYNETKIKINKLDDLSGETGDLDIGSGNRVLATGPIKTADSGARVEIDSSGLRTYDSGDKKRVEIPTAADKISLYSPTEVLEGIIEGSGGELKITLTNYLELEDAVDGNAQISFTPDGPDGSTIHTSVAGHSLVLDGRAGVILEYYGTKRIEVDATGIGVFTATPVAKQTVSGSRGGNAALASFLTAMANYGWITDSSSA